MNLNLGAGRKKMDSFIGVDKLPVSDIVLDIESDVWPWDDGDVDEILAEHVVEHLRSLPDFMNNCHRVMKPGGKLTIITPHPLCEFFWQDPTHVRGYTANTFVLYCVGASGSEHAQIKAWKHADVYEQAGIINGVKARIIKAVMTR